MISMLKMLLRRYEPETVEDLESWSKVPQRRALYVERPCIGCLRMFKKWGVTSIPLIEQFCSRGCENSFFKGYDLGLRVNGSMSRWPKMGGR